MKLTLDKMSRLVVSKGLRDRFALKPGDSLEVTLDPDGFRLRPVQPSSPIFEALKGEIPEPGDAPAEPVAPSAA